MADVRRTTTREMRERSAATTTAAATLKRSREKIEPSSGWTEDSRGHYLLVDLPDFKKDEVKLEVNTSGQIIVRGERQDNEKKYVHFELNLPIPPNSDVENITGKFDGEILYVTVPKVVAVMEEKKEPEILEMTNVEGVTAAENVHPKSKNDIAECSKKEDGTNGGECSNKLGNAHIFFSPANIRKWEQEEGILRSAIEMLSKNKGIVITAALAFSLGMLISRKFQPTGQ